MSLCDAVKFCETPENDYCRTIMAPMTLGEFIQNAPSWLRECVSAWSIDCWLSQEQLNKSEEQARIDDACDAQSESFAFRRQFNY